MKCFHSTGGRSRCGWEPTSAALADEPVTTSSQGVKRSISGSSFNFTTQDYTTLQLSPTINIRLYIDIHDEHLGLRIAWATSEGTSLPAYDVREGYDSGLTAPLLLTT
jgi:hypothetical protein